MEKRLGPFPSTPEGALAPTLGERSGAPSGLRPSSFVICNTPVEVQFTSAGCLNYPCRTPVHGRQQLSLFNAHYDEHCFLPIHVYDTERSGPVAVVLRPGKTPSGV